MIKGEQREQKESKGKKLYVGLGPVELAAFNPSKTEINKLTGKEDDDEDRPIEYLGEDKEGNQRLRLAFWLKSLSDVTDKHFVHSFNLTNKVRTNKNGDKVQVINQTLNTTWVPLKVDKKGEVTDEPDFSLLPNWFVTFTDKEGNEIGKKKYRAALLGEEELATLLRAWLSINWNHPEAEVMIDTKKLFSEDYSEIRDMIGTALTKSFTATLGVRTDENDSTKQYQQVYGKAFLPKGFTEHLEKNFKGSSDYIKRVWAKFEDEIQGEYGFSSHYILEPIQEYDPKKDVAQAPGTRADVTPMNSKF